MMPIQIRPLTLFLAIALLSACAGVETDPTRDWSAERFYKEGKEALANSDYAGAVRQFETLTARHPYGPYAEQAMLELAYVHYKDGDPASAVASANRFLRQYPAHENVDYAMYLKGLASFEDAQNFLERWFSNQDLSARDTTGMRNAWEAFKEVSRRFPDSRYAPDSLVRMQRLTRYLAKHEIEVAQFYARKRAWVGVTNRAKFVLETFSQTPFVEDALGLMVAAYRELNEPVLAEDARRVLALNYPGSRYLK